MDVAVQKPECVSAHSIPQDESLSLLIYKRREYIYREALTQKKANGKRNSVRFFPTPMREGIPQNIVLKF